MDKKNLICEEGEPAGFFLEAQAKKVCEMLRYIYSLHCEVVPSIRKERPYFLLRYSEEEKKKALELDREIGALCMANRWFKVGAAFPTEILADGTRFPSVLIDPER